MNGEEEKKGDYFVTGHNIRVPCPACQSNLLAEVELTFSEEVPLPHEQIIDLKLDDNQQGTLLSKLYEVTGVAEMMLRNTGPAIVNLDEVLKEILVIAKKTLEGNPNDR